ncbi:MAG: SUMF1/EgtB/PvdO family nonheme iron enzyme, partial [Bacteroidota bacterium]
SESKQIEYTKKEIEAPIPIPEKIEESIPEPIKKETFKLPQAGKYAALFLVFLMAGTTGAWALTPPPVRDWWKASIIDTADAYQKYIDTWDKTKAENPRVDKAYYLRAERSGRLEDLRAYQKEIGIRGIFKEKVRERIREQETKAIEILEKQADLPLLQRFLTDYPDATQLPRLKSVVEQHLPETQKTEALTLLEQAYVRSMNSDPQPQKFKQYVQDFPKLARLSDIVAAAANDRKVLNAVQSDIDQAIVKKTVAAESPAQTYEALKTLEQYGSDHAVKQVTEVIEKKPAPIRRAVAERLNTATIAVQQRVAEHKEQQKQEDRNPGKTSAVEQNTAQGKNLAETQVQTSPTVQNEPAQNKQEPAKPADISGAPAQNEPAQDKQEAAAPTDLPAAAALSLEMARVPAGDFRMGDLFDEGATYEKPVHQVSLSAFEIGKYEVTQALWFAIMNERPSNHKNCDDCPVEQVSWNDVQDFLKRLNDRFPGKNYRLPTEAEWEYAAREGGKKVRFGNGQDIADPAKINFNGSNSYKQTYSLSGLNRGKTVAVGSLRNPNALGLHDMSGNVREWCNDWYGDYTTENQKNPRGPTSGSYRVICGGSWYSYPQSCRVAVRYSGTPTDRDDDIGFRLARTK